MQQGDLDAFCHPMRPRSAIVQMPVALRRRGLGRLARHGAGTRRHDDRRRGMARGDTAVDTLLIIRAVAGERGDRAVGLVEQGTDLRGVVARIRPVALQVEPE